MRFWKRNQEPEKAMTPEEIKAQMCERLDQQLDKTINTILKRLEKEHYVMLENGKIHMHLDWMPEQEKIQERLNALGFTVEISRKDQDSNWRIVFSFPERNLEIKNSLQIGGEGTGGNKDNKRD